MPRFTLRTLFLAVLVCAIFCAAVLFLYIRPNANAELNIRNSPIQISVRVDEYGTVTSDRKTYSIGQYGVTEFGTIRIAVRGCTFPGKSSGGLTLASRFAGGNGSTGVGNRRFVHNRIVGGSQCTFADINFTIIDSELKILGKTFAANEEPILILVDRDGKIESVDVIVN